MQTTLELVATKAQREIIGYMGKFLVVIAGRRWGKTIGVICNHIVDKCAATKARPVEYLMTAPSMPQVKAVFDRLSSNVALSVCIREIQKKYYPLIVWQDGSRTHFRTLDQPDLLRGGAYDWICLDEIQNAREHDIDSVLLPMLADRRGRLLLCGQGRGEEHWIYQRFFLPGQQAKNSHWIRSWQFSIRDGLCFQDAEGKEELARLKDVTPPDVWEEEYEGRFVSSGRNVFRSQDIQGCLRGQLITVPESRTTYIVAADLGRVADPSAWLVLDAAAAQVVHAEVRPFRERHDHASQQLEILRLRYNDAICVIDKTGYGYGSASKVDEYVREYDRVVKRLVPFFWSPQTKRRIIDTLALAIEKHKIGIPEQARELRRQLGVYEFRKRGDMVHSQAPTGDHDDLVAALAMAWNAYSLGMANSVGMAGADAMF